MLSVARYSRLAPRAEADGARCRSKGLAPRRRDTGARARLFHRWASVIRHLTPEDRDDLFDAWLDGFAQGEDENPHGGPPAAAPAGYR